MQTLHDLTQRYWALSRMHNGRDPGHLTVGDALQGLSSVIRDLDPGRPLTRVAYDLQQWIIINGSRRKAS